MKILHIMMCRVCQCRDGIFVALIVCTLVRNTIFRQEYRRSKVINNSAAGMMMAANQVFNVQAEQALHGYEPDYYVVHHDSGDDLLLPASETLHQQLQVPLLVAEPSAPPLSDLNSPAHHAIQIQPPPAHQPHQQHVYTTEIVPLPVVPVSSATPFFPFFVALFLNPLKNFWCCPCFDFCPDQSCCCGSRCGSFFGLGTFCGVIFTAVMFVCNAALSVLV